MTLLCGILSLLSCEYNADLRVHIPGWEGGLSPVGVLAVSPRPDGAAEEPPFAAESCQSLPDRIAVSFYLANDRDQPVGEGDRLRVDGAVLRPQGALLASPDRPDQSVALEFVSLERASGETVSLAATVESVTWVPGPAPDRARLLLLHDHGSRTGAWDTNDERLAAYSEITQAALCRADPSGRCEVDPPASLSLYRLSDDQTSVVVQATRDVDAVETALTGLRQVAEQGRAPVLFRADGVTAGGLPTALGECGEGSASCDPVAVLITAEPVTDASRLSPDALPPSARLLLAAPTDSPGLRLLACQTGGFFWQVDRPAALRQRVNRSQTSIPEYRYGFARAATLALRGHWEATVRLASLPADLRPSEPLLLSGTLTITLGTQHVSQEFTAPLGGY